MSYKNSFQNSKNVLRLLLLFSITITSFNAIAKIPRDFKIGSGSKGAMFYPVANNICNIYNKYSKLDRKCQAETSNGSYRNLVNLDRSRIDLGISQSSLQYDYYTNENDDLRTVTFLHNEYLSILVNDKINSFNDLLDKKVNLGNHGSGSHLFFQRIMKAKKWKNKEFKKVYLQPSSLIAELFCNKQIDAAVYTVGHPNKIFEQAINECGGRILSLTKHEIEELIAILPEFIPANITRKIYKNQPNNISSIAIPVVLSASNDLNNEIVSELLEIVKTHRSELIKAHPVFKQIDFRLKKKANYAPIHDGASQFYTKK